MYTLSLIFLGVLFIRIGRLYLKHFFAKLSFTLIVCMFLAIRVLCWCIVLFSISCKLFKYSGTFFVYQFVVKL